MVLAPAAAALALAAPIFTAPYQVAQVPQDGYLSEIGVADLTGDRFPDILGVRIDDSAPAATHPVVVLAGNGKGGFKDATAQVFVGAVSRTQHPRQIVFADFNRDGRMDAFIADHGYDHPPFPGFQNTLILSAPGGKLVDATKNLPQQSDFTHSAAAADVNGDGAPDLYVGNLTTPGAEILANDGTGHFTPLPDALPFLGDASFTRETFADVDGDGDQDLVLLSMRDHDGIATGPSRVLLNDGHGHFTELPGALPAKPSSGASEGLAAAAVDLNGDRKVDLLLGYSRAGGPGQRFYADRWIQVLINNGNGTFRDETSLRLPQAPNALDWPYAIRVADLNGDRKPDFVVSLSEEVTNAVPPAYLNRGDGTFKRLPLAPPPGPMLDVADVNRDGKVDIVSAVPTSSRETYSVMQQVVEPKGPFTSAKPKHKLKPKTKRRRHHP